MPFWGKKKPEVAPVGKEELRKKILALNNPSNPYEIKKSDETDLAVEWKIVEAEWRGRGGAEEELKKGYKAWILLDEESHEARYCEQKETEEMKEKPGIFGLGGISKQKTTFRGKMFFSKEKGAMYQGGQKVYGYEFDVKKVREPIKKAVEESGWQFKQVMRKASATYQ